MPRSAFTLIELLVVVAIIAILAALLIPGVNLVRDSANLSNCASNQRQIVLAMASYKADDGSWPCRPTDWNGALPTTPWSGAAPTDYPVYTTVTFEWLCNKMDGQLPPRLFVCPARKNNIPPVANEKFKSFNANGWAPPEGTNQQGPRWRPDANSTGKPNVMAYAYDWAVPRKAAPNRPILADRPLNTGGQSLRSTHGKRSGNTYLVNVAFVDGHVESVRAKVDPNGNTSGWTHNQDLDKSVAAKWESDLNTDADTKLAGDNIYSQLQDGGLPTQPGRGSTTRAWVK
ncbi:MAG: prepilin-type N-terminal cleavage/methylation domain-containing protein [Planctomycetota bacterium]|nr:prepilin-type N-terminal cleavage/methylation domain-containing protein [Planctomycetota bacterium]